jgi:predicted DNA-binding transcriptional regulator YafY
MPRWFHGTEPVPHLRTLAEAVRLGRWLRLGYRRDDGSPGKTREVGPLGLVNKAGTWYLVASRLAMREHGAGQREHGAGQREHEAGQREHEAGQREHGAGQREHGTVENAEPAVFRVGRVTSARLLAAEVVRPGGFDLAAFWERWSAAFVTSRPQVEVHVRATATALAIFPYVFGDAGRRAAEAAGPADTGGLREVVLTFEEERAAAHRLAGFGGQVAVISPDVVRAELITTATELLARYRELRITKNHHSERVRAPPASAPRSCGGR